MNSSEIRTAFEQFPEIQGPLSVSRIGVRPSRAQGGSTAEHPPPIQRRYSNGNSCARGRAHSLLVASLRLCVLALIPLVLAFAARANAGSAHFRPTDLRCEYLKDPLGIDTPHPRLSWILQPDNRAPRGQRQTAYEILVATAE